MDPSQAAQQARKEGPDACKLALRSLGDDELLDLLARLRRVVSGLGDATTDAGRRTREAYLDRLEAARLEIERRAV